MVSLNTHYQNIHGAYHVFIQYVKHPFEVGTIITSILRVTA